MKFAKVMFLGLALSGLSASAEVGIGRPIYPSSLLSKESVDVANVLLAAGPEIQRQLGYNALAGKVHIVNGSMQVRMPIGKDHRIFVFTLQECRTTASSSCQYTGSLEVHEHVFLRPGEEMKSYDVLLNMPSE